jgi:hypothetical protein
LIEEMISQKDKDFINKCFDALYRRREPEGNYLEAKEPPFEAENGGVPPEMFAGEVGEVSKGYVKWKLLESTLDESAIEALENEYDVKFPALFRAYLTTGFHLFDDLNNGEEWIMLPPVPADNPLGEIRFYLDGWRPLIKFGLVPFGSYKDGWGAICFDTRNAAGEKDFPIVWLNNDLLGEEMSADEVESLAKPVFESFEELMTKMFLDEK